MLCMQHGAIHRTIMTVFVYKRLACAFLQKKNKSKTNDFVRRDVAVFYIDKNSRRLNPWRVSSILKFNTIKKMKPVRSYMGMPKELFHNFMKKQNKSTNSKKTTTPKNARTDEMKHSCSTKTKLTLTHQTANVIE